MRAPKGLDAWLAGVEAPHAPRPGCAKSIHWAGAKGAVTDWSVVFVHGFSASALELAPLPQLVADGLRANLHLTRLAGHGQDGPAMGRATFAAWQADTTQALDIAGAIGRRVLAIGCSTGCTLLTGALATRAIAGVVMISPNYMLGTVLGQFLLDLPAARKLAPVIVPRQIGLPPQSAAHAAGWTTSYPITALYPMADAIQALRGADLAAVTTPALFAFTESDKVVNPAETNRVMARWGGPVTHHPLTPGPTDDPNHHVMAGDVFSPRQTAPLAAAITAWGRAL